MNVSNGLDAAILAVAKAAGDHADDVDRASRIPEEAVRAFQTEALMGLLIPASLGGPGRSMSQVASVCHAVAQFCGSSAMIYAMHQIQVACIIAHGTESDWHRTLLRRICDDQLLLGSVTSEVGTGGNIHASVCAVEAADGRAQLTKKATTISYGARADSLLITARRNEKAAANDQVMVVALRGDYELEKTSA
jgi:acyl-CoA dehydrogenase